MRVYIIEMFGKGGLIHYSFQLCQALQRVGLDTTLVTSKDYELANLPHNFTVARLFDLWDPKPSDPIGGVRQKIRRGLRGGHYVLEWFRLLRFLRREKPDVVIFGEIRFAFEAWFLRVLRASGFALVDIVHDVQVYDVRRASDDIVVRSQGHLARYRSLYGLFSALFVHSRSNLELFVELYQVPVKNVHQIEHATSELMLRVPQQYTADELEKKIGISPGRVVVTFFGTITKYKGVEDLICAFPMVLKAHEAQLLIAGFPAKDVDPAKLKSLACALGIADSVTWFLDYVPNEWVATMMEISDVIVLPYRAITQSGILQIAFACGRPVVVTRTGGLPEIVEDGETGRIAEPMDPASLAKSIIEIIEDRERSRKMGARARALSDTRFSWQAVAATMRDVLETINDR
jgi:glycosyltransferase involved in cell wall biosynthesis